MRRDAAAKIVAKPGERTRTFAITDDTVDRYNTTFDPGGWTFRNFELNPVVLLNHGGGWSSTDELPILGRGDNIRREGNRILSDVTFFRKEDQGGHPEVDRVLQLLDQGVLASSIRADVDPTAVEYNEDRETGDDWTDWLYPPLDFKRQDLIEFSIVYLPGNPNAVPPGRSLAPEMRQLLERFEIQALRGKHERETADLMMRRELGKKLKAARGAKTEPVPAPAPVVDPAKDPVIEPVRWTIPEGFDLAKNVEKIVGETLDKERRALQAAQRGRLTPE